MKLVHVFAASTIMIASQTAVPLYAQSAGSVAAVTNSCASGDGCVVAVQQYIASLKAQGLAPAQLDKAIADLTASLGSAIQTEAAKGELTGAVARGISEAISQASTEIADTAQRSQTRQGCSTGGFHRG